MNPLRKRLGPGAWRRRMAKIARRREELGKAPQPPQEPIDREAARATAMKLRKRLAQRIRQKLRAEPDVAARAIRMLGLPRRVPKPRKKKAAAS